MRRARYLPGAVAGIVLVAVGGATLLSVALRLDVPPELQGVLLRGTALVLILFMALLVFRYLALLWLGFLQYLESGAADDDAAPPFLPPISVIIPAYNEGPTIQAAIRSVLRQTYPRFEVIVVDDGSTDDTLRRASQLEGRYGGITVRVISKSNSGKAGALNTGIANARHPFVLCMDSDSRLSENTMRRAIRHFRHPAVAAVAGNVKVANRLNLWTRLQALEYIEGLNMARRAQGFMRAVNIIPGPIGVFRRDVLDRVGGYDSDTYAEDADLTLKILTAGWRIEYEDAAIAYTEAPEKLLDLIKQRYRWTRGILQAAGKRRCAILNPVSVVVALSVAIMLFESILWPLMNVLGSLVFVAFAIAFGGSAYLVTWWLMLTLLDVAAAVYTVALEEEDISLVPLALVYRFFFILLIDIAKLGATVEQAFKVEMSWGQIQRIGRI